MAAELAQDDQDHANRIFLALLQAQERYALTQREQIAAQEARDEAILEASRWGFTRRAVAEAVAMTVGRVQQIIDRHGGVAAHEARLPPGKRWRYPVNDPRRFQA